MSDTWANRIVGHENVPPSALAPSALNARRHPQNQSAALSGVLSELGWIQSVVASKRTGNILDGHLRVELALSRGEPTVPVVWVDVDPSEEAYALATLDPLAALAQTDAATLEALLGSVSTQDAAVQAMLDGLAAEAGILATPDVAEDPGAQLDRAEELCAKWGTERGQLWEIGRHRLLCGDATSAEDVARLMGGERATAVVTDSPYGINREGVANDSPEGLRSLFDDMLAVLPADDAVVLNFQSPRLVPVWIDALRAAGHKFERMLWMYDENDQTKPWHYWLMCSQSIVVSSVGAPDWAECKSHHDTYVIGLAREWRAGGDGNDFAHASVKPAGLVADLLNHTTGLVYEPFSGSGTTPVAAEQTGRTCYAMEIEPKYVAVALGRLAGMGLTPRLAG